VELSSINLVDAYGGITLTNGDSIVPKDGALVYQPKPRPMPMEEGKTAEEAGNDSMAWQLEVVASHQPIHYVSLPQVEQVRLNIIVNGVVRVAMHPYISYDEVVTMALGRIIRDCTVAYANGPLEAASGSLLPGQGVAVVDGMVFNAVMTTGA
jgi:hypothetical protein